MPKREGMVIAFLAEHGFKWFLRNNDPRSWVLLSESEGQELIGFLQLRFGISSADAKRAVCRSQSIPDTFFVNHGQLKQIVETWNEANL